MVKRDNNNPITKIYRLIVFMAGFILFEIINRYKNMNIREEDIGGRERGRE